MRGILGAIGVVAALVFATLGLVVVLNLTIYLEASVPGQDDLPALPGDLTVANVTEGCGSGNCYLEFDVEGSPGDAPSSILAQLPPRDECSANSMLDRRPLCVGYRKAVDGVRGYVTLGKWN